MRRLTMGRRPSPALVISLIALFVSVSGVAWAAATIGTNDIKNGAVTKKKLHKNAVSTNKIVNNAVGTSKIANDAVNSAKIAGGSVGAGDLASGAVGPNQLGPVVVRTASISVPATSARIISKACDSGELALSVGANWSGAATVGPVLQAATFLTGSPEPNSGSAAGRNEGAGARTLTVSVACLG